MKPIHVVLVVIVALAVPALVFGAYVAGVVIGLDKTTHKPQPIVRYVTRTSAPAAAPSSLPDVGRVEPGASR
jgi:hypothetical protein